MWRVRMMRVMRMMRVVRMMRVMRVVRMVPMWIVAVVTEVAINGPCTAGWIVATGTIPRRTIGNIDRSSTTKVRFSIER